MVKTPTMLQSGTQFKNNELLSFSSFTFVFFYLFKVFI